MTGVAEDSLPPLLLELELVPQGTQQYLAAQPVVAGTLQTGAVEPAADDRFGQALQEEQQGLCH